MREDEPTAMAAAWSSAVAASDPDHPPALETVEKSVPVFEPPPRPTANQQPEVVVSPTDLEPAAPQSDWLSGRVLITVSPVFDLADRLVVQNVLRTDGLEKMTARAAEGDSITLEAEVFGMVGSELLGKHIATRLNREVDVIIKRPVPCPNCGQSNDLDRVFCTRCNNPLGEVRRFQPEPGEEETGDSFPGRTRWEEPGFEQPRRDEEPLRWGSDSPLPQYRELSESDYPGLPASSPEQHKKSITGRVGRTFRRLTGG